MASMMINDVLLSKTHVSDGSTHVATAPDPEVVSCDCCGFKEECTLEYVDMVRKRFHEKWICGLCAEAVKDEIYKSNHVIGTEEALHLHMKFCKDFKSNVPAKHLIAAVRQIFRRRLDGGKLVGTAPNSPVAANRSSSLSRSGSCVPAFAR